MSVNSKMTAIANATRALDGSTAALTLDGIASKLGVEKTNIAAALAAIAEKGVEVPSGSTSDALASLIAAIETGSGVYVGSLTPTTDTFTFRINCPETVSGSGIKIIPTFACVWDSDLASAPTKDYSGLFAAQYGNQGTMKWVGDTVTFDPSGSVQVGRMINGYCFFNINDKGSFNPGFIANRTYYGVAIV